MGCPGQQDSQKGFEAAVQGVSPPWLPAWLSGGLLDDDAGGYRIETLRLAEDGADRLG